MEYTQACKLAFDYFKAQLGMKGLAVATENNSSWFFSSRKKESTVIGNIIISVSKSNGVLRLVDMLSSEDFAEVQNSIIVDIPAEFKAQ